jgi:hypothetical protein
LKNAKIAAGKYALFAVSAKTAACVTAKVRLVQSAEVSSAKAAADARNARPAAVDVFS